MNNEFFDPILHRDPILVIVSFMDMETKCDFGTLSSYWRKLMIENNLLIFEANINTLDDIKLLPKCLTRFSTRTSSVRVEDEHIGDLPRGLKSLFVAPSNITDVFV